MSTTLWYDRYRNDWIHALPLGNGRVGAMFYGSPDRETIEINEESLWSGRRIKETNHATPADREVTVRMPTNGRTATCDLTAGEPLTLNFDGSQLL